MCAGGFSSMRRSFRRAPLDNPKRENARSGNSINRLMLVFGSALQRRHGFAAKRVLIARLLFCRPAAEVIHHADQSPPDPARASLRFR